MRRTNRRKLRKNKRTQRRKTLSVKRGGYKFGDLQRLLGIKPPKNDSLRSPLLADRDDSAAPVPVPVHVPAPATYQSLPKETKLRVIKLLANLIINNLSEEAKQTICEKSRSPKEVVTNCNSELKLIYENIVSSRKVQYDTNSNYTYTLDGNNDTFVGIWNEICRECGIIPSQYSLLQYYKKQMEVVAPDYLSLSLGLIFKNDYERFIEGFREDKSDSLLYTMIAICIEHFRGKKVVYDFTPMDCQSGQLQYSIQTLQTRY